MFGVDEDDAWLVVAGGPDLERAEDLGDEDQFMVQISGYTLRNLVLGLETVAEVENLDGLTELTPAVTMTTTSRVVAGAQHLMGVTSPITVILNITEDPASPGRVVVADNQTEAALIYDSLCALDRQVTMAESLVAVEEELAALIKAGTSNDDEHLIETVETWQSAKSEAKKSELRLRASLHPRQEHTQEPAPQLAAVEKEVNPIRKEQKRRLSAAEAVITPWLTRIMASDERTTAIVNSCTCDPPTYKRDAQVGQEIDIVLDADGYLWIECHICDGMDRIVSHDKNGGERQLHRTDKSFRWLARTFHHPTDDRSLQQMMYVKKH